MEVLAYLEIREEWGRVGRSGGSEEGCESHFFSPIQMDSGHEVVFGSQS